MSGSATPYTHSEKADVESQPTSMHLHNPSAATVGNINGIPVLHGDKSQVAWMPAFGGAFQPAPYQPSFRKFGNPAPLGLCAFALTTFVLSLINAQTRGVTVPAIVVGSAFAYGGFIQLLAGMWEMAVGSK